MVRAELGIGAVAGQRRRLTTYWETEAEAEDWLSRTRSLLAGGRGLPSRLPLGDYLGDWLARHEPIAHKTRTLYGQVIAGMPGWLLSAPLGRLSPAMAQEWLDGMEGVSPRTIQIRRNVLRAALNDALRRELVDRNAAALARPPRQRRPRRVSVTAADCAAILAALDAHTVAAADGEPVEVPAWRYRPAAALAIACGLRQGELLGLSWADIGPDRVTVRQRLTREEGKYVVREGTKAEDGGPARTVPLPAFARAALDGWRAEQAAEMRAAGGPEPLDRGVLPVFTTASGGMVNGTVLLHQFQARLADAGLKRLRWHDLRHATADVLASTGAPQTVARDILRHASVTTTADHYTGSSWADMASASEALDRAIGGR